MLGKTDKFKECTGNDIRRYRVVVEYDEIDEAKLAIQDF